MTDDARTHAHSNSEEFYEVDVETFCSQRKREVILTLRSRSRPASEIVSGKPVFCNFQFVCQSEMNPLLLAENCFLHALRIETRRRP